MDNLKPVKAAFQDLLTMTKGAVSRLKFTSKAAKEQLAKSQTVANHGHKKRDKALSVEIEIDMFEYAASFGTPVQSGIMSELAKECPGGLSKLEQPRVIRDCGVHGD